jgi:hypothetical protein
MSDDPSSKKLADVRREACEFLSNDDFRTTEKVRHDGTKNGFTECRMIDFLHDLLESGFDFHEVQLGEPPARAASAMLSIMQTEKVCILNLS